MLSKMKSLLPVTFTLFVFTVNAQRDVKPVTLQIDLSKKTKEPLKPIWAWFGYDEPNYTYMKDGKKLLSEMC